MNVDKLPPVPPRNITPPRFGLPAKVGLGGLVIAVSVTLVVVLASGGDEQVIRDPAEFKSRIEAMPSTHDPSGAVTPTAGDPAKAGGDPAGGAAAPAGDPKKWIYKTNTVRMELAAPDPTAHQPPGTKRYDGEEAPPVDDDTRPDSESGPAPK